MVWVVMLTVLGVLLTQQILLFEHCIENNFITCGWVHFFENLNNIITCDVVPFVQFKR